MSILVVRLGAMGDIVHALPAVTSLKLSFPDEEIVWVVKRRWIELLTGNPAIDRLILVENQNSVASLRELRAICPNLAIDFQGLLQSAIIARLSRPSQLWGFDRAVAREPFAARFYNRRVHVTGPHRIQRNLQLVSAIGAARLTDEAWLPAGDRGGALPDGDFVLASPFAGWAGKQWPLESYVELAGLLHGEGLKLVLNVSGAAPPGLSTLPNVYIHVSSIAGLIGATRQAAAVVGVDSGPLHIAAALGKPGVAIYGPTDPSATGPYGGSIRVLRTAGADTTYDRHKEIQASMRSIHPQDVFSELLRTLEPRVTPARGEAIG